MTKLDTRNPLEIYVIATLGGLDRAVADAVLTEPKVRDATLARWAITCVTETLAGLAIGATIGAVADAIRRTFGVTPVVSTAVEPGPRPAPWLEAERAITAVAELKHELRRRLALGHRAVLEMLAPIEDQIAARDRAAYTSVLGVLARDELVAERYAPQLQAGWRCTAAAIESRTIPAIDPLWQRWALRFRRERAAITPSTGDLASAGVILQIG